MALAVLLLLAGCGRRQLSPSDAPSSGTAPVQADVVAIHPGPDDHSLTVEVEVPAGEPGCGENPRLGYHAEENGRIFANVVVDSPRSLVYGACPQRASVTAVLRFEMVVAGKPLSVNTDQLWDPGDPDYRRCPDILGCHPPADHCARVWIDELVSHMDVPRHSYLHTVHCDQSWLVLDVDTSAGACGAGRPGCSAPPHFTRYFLRFDGAWKEITGSRRAGCVDVLAREPAFPKAFCADLGAPGE
jgi:hypothetical protein